MNLVDLAISAQLVTGVAGAASAPVDRAANDEERVFADDEPGRSSIENRLEALERQLAATRASDEPAEPGASNEPRVTLDSRGLRVETVDGEANVVIGGRVQVDANLHARDATHNGTEIKDGTELRRARIELKGRLPGDVLWAAEVDFAGDKSEIKDFWVGFEQPWVTTTIGHQKQPFSLGLEMSTNDIPFIERGVDNFLVVPFVDRAIGIRLQGNGDHVFVAGGVYGEGVSDVSVDDEGWGVATRVVTAPLHEDDHVLHLGTRGAYRVPMDQGTSVRIRDETTNISNFSVVDTGAITDVDATALWGGEAAWAYGPFSLSGEFNSVHLMRGGSDYNLSSWHVETTYTLTGESRAPAYRLDAGEFKRLVASGEHDYGAWELASRFATIDLNDGSSLRGGREDVATLGLNWYFNANVRFMLGWSRILAASGAGIATNPNRADGTDFFTLRAQLNF